jgi:TatD DNase family protein
MLIDTHAHLEMREFDDDRDDVIKRAAGAGVKYIITIGTTVESSQAAVLLADKHPGVYAAVGVHPHESKDILHPAYEILEPCRASGRGLRRDRPRLLLRSFPRNVQQRVFRDSSARPGSSNCGHRA